MIGVDYIKAHFKRHSADVAPLPLTPYLWQIWLTCLMADSPCWSCCPVSRPGVPLGRHCWGHFHCCCSLLRVAPRYPPHPSPCCPTRDTGCRAVLLHGWRSVGSLSGNLMKRIQKNVLYVKIAWQQHWRATMGSTAVCAGVFGPYNKGRGATTEKAPTGDTPSPTAIKQAWFLFDLFYAAVPLFSILITNYFNETALPVPHVGIFTIESLSWFFSLTFHA